MSILLKRRRKPPLNWDDDSESGDVSLLTLKRADDTIKPENIRYINEEGEEQQIVLKRKVVQRKGSGLLPLTESGFYFITPMILGIVIGLAVDRWMGTKPMFTLIGIGFGTVGMFYNLVKLITDASHQH